MAKVSPTHEWGNKAGTTGNWSATSSENKRSESGKKNQASQNEKTTANKPSAWDLKDGGTRGKGTGGTSGWNQWNAGSAGEEKSKESGSGNGGGWSQWPAGGKEPKKDSNKTPSNEEVFDQDSVRLQQGIILVCKLNRLHAFN